ncbi:MAG TPA: diguanylate cyclase [Trichocoleus sp.]
MKRIIEYFIPDNIPNDVESQHKARLTVGVLLVIAYFNLNYTVISYLINYPGGLFSQVPLLVASLASLFLFKHKFPTKIIYPAYFFFCSLSISITVFYSGGYNSLLFPWLASTPIVAVLVWSKRGSLLSLFFVLVIEIGFFYLYYQDYNFPNQIQPAIQKIFYLTCNLGLVLILYGITIVFENAKDDAFRSLQEKNYELAVEKEKSEKLLMSLKAANDELERLVTFDSLTQIANRRKFDEYLEQEWKRLIRTQSALSLILFDADFFKSYNDCYGHQAGDICLRAIAQAARKVVNRPADLVARYGGEEFAVILPGTSQPGAIAVAEQIRQAVQALAISHERSEVDGMVTISLGIASMIPVVSDSVGELLHRADIALYTAKQQGRNRFSVWSSKD